MSSLILFNPIFLFGNFPYRLVVFYIFITSLCCRPALAQFSDSFADGNFSEQPPWVGHTDLFVVDDSRLRLNAPSTSNVAFLSTVSTAIDNASWTCKITLNFNPSGNNFARVYLTSDKVDISTTLNGYFVAIGEENDEISLYRQQGRTLEKIIDGQDNRLNLSSVSATIQVTRDKSGTWALYTDIDNTGKPKKEGSTHDDTFPRSTHFGVFCNYTSSRATKFFFDDFIVTGNPYTDTDPPVVLSVEVVSGTEIAVVFDGSLDQRTAQNLTTYSIDRGIENPSRATLQPSKDTVMLTFEKALTNGLAYTLTIVKIADANGNVSPQLSRSFRYLKTVPATYKDIIFSEFLARPSPVVQLPDVEFIELHNRSSKPFSLMGWMLSDDRTTAILPGEIILPGHYRIITSIAGAAAFGSTLLSIGVSSFPTLNNDEDRLTLKDATGQTIDSLYYTTTWYRNTTKAQGGWSLELIDPDDICRDRENWQASESQQGGTPGMPNSVLASKPDMHGPKLMSIVAIDSFNLLLSFDEKLDYPLRSTITFSFTPSLIVNTSTLERPSLHSISLQLRTPLQPKQLYTLNIQGVYDCSGNVIQKDFSKLDFALPEQGAPQDILINEILFNPLPGGEDFIEIYNPSDKYIDLKGWHIIRPDNGIIKNPISDTSAIIAPKTYRVFTPDPVSLKDRYPQGIESLFMRVALPPLPDDRGTIVLAGNNNVTIDSLFYSRDFHSPFIRNDEGVSLERISFTSTTNAQDNWRSASSIAGFATPGRVNSNSRPDTPTTTGQITVEPAIFIPYSGAADFAKINFHFARSGLVATVKILDHYGRAIKTLANNDILGFDGFFRWEGDKDDGSRARTGYYYINFMVFEPTGTVSRFRKRVIVAAP